MATIDAGMRREPPGNRGGNEFMPPSAKVTIGRGYPAQNHSSGIRLSLPADFAPCWKPHRAQIHHAQDRNKPIVRLGRDTADGGKHRRYHLGMTAFTRPSLPATPMHLEAYRRCIWFTARHQDTGAFPVRTGDEECSGLSPASIPHRHAHPLRSEDAPSQVCAFGYKNEEEARANIKNFT